MTLREYAPGAIDRRRVRGEPLRPRTCALYASQLERLVFPTFGDEPLRSITRDDVTRWYDFLGPAHPTQRAHAYSLLRAIMGQAVTEGLVAHPARRNRRESGRADTPQRAFWPRGWAGAG
ncbi:hypothetical protein LG324_08810 [Phycicoccus jejuensis]|uniref:hypothetical protein n=1 Tax=Phycicoccus jejuensis TaxID=367299 RepID=UPI00384C7707